jgi:hypothetical protein
MRILNDTKMLLHPTTQQQTSPSLLLFLQLREYRPLEMSLQQEAGRVPGQGDMSAT